MAFHRMLEKTNNMTDKEIKSIKNREYYLKTREWKLYKQKQYYQANKKERDEYQRNYDLKKSL